MVKKRQHDVHEGDSSTDSCEEDQNGQNGIRSICQHIKKSVDTARLRRQLKGTGLLFECPQCQKLGQTTKTTVGDFEYDNTLWLCLKCGTQLCGRARNQHALHHHQTPHSDSHALTMNTRSFEIWCYECDAEVLAHTRKNLLECVEIVKRLAQKPVASPVEEAAPASISNIEYKIKSTVEHLTNVIPLSGGSYDDSSFGRRTSKRINPLPPPPPPGGLGSAITAVPGVAKRVEIFNTLVGNAVNSAVAEASITELPVIIPDEKERLPRVRGLTNLGNTCFFNAVMQCLAQTPFLLGVLKELSKAGEEFVLPGGVFTLKDQGEVELPKIQGTLSSWGGLTAALAHTLEELQTGGSVFTPSRLFDKLCLKCPQFTGGDQHDSHELLRQLLESVRSEDLKRYQRVILHSLGYKDQDINSVSEEMRQKCKIYGNQAADRILRPEQVFRGFLVSTLTCQDCFNVSSRHEYFLDISLPVTVEKPQPPQRRRNSPEVMPTTSSNVPSVGGSFNANDKKFNSGINKKFSNDDSSSSKPFSTPSFFLHSPEMATDLSTAPTKSQVKKEKERERKAKRAAKLQRTKQAQKMAYKTTCMGDHHRPKHMSTQQMPVGGGDIQLDSKSADFVNWAEGPREDTLSSSVTTSEHSDADVEDNLVDDPTKKSAAPTAPTIAKCGGATVLNNFTDTNGNTTQQNAPNQQQQEEQQQEQQRLGEKRDDTPENMDKDSLEEDENDSGIATSPPPNATASNDNANVNNNQNNDDTGANIERVISNSSIVNAGLSEKGASYICKMSDTVVSSASSATSTSSRAKAGDANELAAQLEKLELLKQRQEQASSKRVRTQSHSDWSTTIAPRYQCDDGECSVQSCLNNFTAVELMTGQNKVGCESCTRNNNDGNNGPDAKMVNTNATKQLLISSPPAVLILHLKRFQLGPRCMFRKLTRTVSYPMLLDIAPFCGSKVKNLPNINRKQKKLLYALYGIVEHSGGMYGGHYTAYVKVRAELPLDDKRWKFLPHGSKAELDQDDDQLKKLEELLAKEKARDMRISAMDDSDDFSNSSSNSSVANVRTKKPKEPINDVASTADTDADADADAAANSPANADDNAGAVPVCEMNDNESEMAPPTLPDDEAIDVKPPPGKWYYVSDSRVQEVSEEAANRAQAYLLFYERIY